MRQPCEDLNPFEDLETKVNNQNDYITASDVSLQVLPWHS